VERSLSVLLPVRNVESTLASTVHKLLEVVPELTRDFELVIVDDGSSDATIEVADELAVQYPQIRVVRHGRPMGPEAAIQSGLRSSRGDAIVLQNEWLTDQPSLCQRLSSLGYRWHEGPVREREVSGGKPSSGPRAPNFLSRLRDFALGE